MLEDGSAVTLDPQTEHLIAAQHEVQVLDGCSRSTFSKVIENRHQQYVTGWVFNDVYFDSIGVVAFLWIEASFVA